MHLENCTCSIFFGWKLMAASAWHHAPQAPASWIIAWTREDNISQACHSVYQLTGMVIKRWEADLANFIVMHWQLATRGYYWLVDASTSYDSGRVASSRCQLPRFSHSCFGILRCRVPPIPFSYNWHFLTKYYGDHKIICNFRFSYGTFICMSRANTTIGACQIRWLLSHLDHIVGGLGFNSHPKLAQSERQFLLPSLPPHHVSKKNARIH